MQSSSRDGSPATGGELHDRRRRRHTPSVETRASSSGDRTKGAASVTGAPASPAAQQPSSPCRRGTKPGGCCAASQAHKAQAPSGSLLRRGAASCSGDDALSHVRRTSAKRGGSWRGGLALTCQGDRRRRALEQLAASCPWRGTAAAGIYCGPAIDPARRDRRRHCICSSTAVCSHRRQA
jgi:hypothetical protein